MVRVSPTNNLKFTNPEIAKIVVNIYNKDGSVSNKTVEEVTPGTTMRAKFSCHKSEPKHGDYISRIVDRVRGGACPTCSGRRIEKGINDLKTTHPILANNIVLIYENDGSISNKTVEDISAGSPLKAEFLCPKPELGHETSKATIISRTRNKDTCPTCSGKRVEKGINDLKTTHPVVANNLVRIYEKDGSISDKTVQEVSAGSNLKAEFRCPKPELGHGTSITTINDRTNGIGCPTCASQRVEKGINDLETTHPLLAQQIIRIFEKNGSISNKTVREVSAGSNLKAEFRCSKPELGHGTSVAVISNRTNGKGCPTCASQRIEKGINDLETTHPLLAQQIIRIFKKDGSVSNKTVQEVASGSIYKAEWVCTNKETNHGSYFASIRDRTKALGTGCPSCATGKTESLFRDSFTQHSKNNFTNTRIPLERPNFKRGIMQVDMLCDNLNLIVEYDGTWAHGGVNNANKNITAEECFARDIESTIALIKAGYKVIRIREHSHYEKLPFIDLPEEFADNLYQVTYKSFGKDKEGIDALVKRIIEERKVWFVPSASNNETYTAQDLAVSV